MNSTTDIFFIQTTDISVSSQLSGQLGYLQRQGMRVAVASSDTGLLGSLAERDKVASYALPIERDPSVLSDLRALWRIFRLVRKLQPDVVVYGTPKASLLAAIASWLLRKPRRIYYVYGLRAETMTGVSKRLMLLIEKTIIWLSTDVVAVGHALKEQMIQAGLTDDVRVFGKGSANSIDLESYQLKGQDPELRKSFRADHGIPAEVEVVGFVGRITADKGIDALVGAMQSLRQHLGDVHLVLVGPDDGIESLLPETVAAFRQPWVHMTGNVEDTSIVYAALDLLCLPSRREGLPTVLLEAAASGTPIVATDATGVRDVIPDPGCGAVVPIDDASSLAAALGTVLKNPEEAKAVARNAQVVVFREFDRERLWKRQYLFYAGETETGRSSLMTRKQK
ncbi:glycosyltransferase [Paenarthrobacter sp. RAF54_2]|uniref:glycosyltransferase n=1 Tax=Paenarthrobacter sp. RAF54_2 TaxID=3233061 RepID=UPI003F99F551